MNYFLDCEFWERPYTIDLISIGVVCEDGTEFYAESSDFDEDACDNTWLHKNVIAHLGPKENRISRPRIAVQLLKFIKPTPKPVFWGYYSDYDWVVTSWLFGPMVGLPDHFPKYCRDLKQELDNRGNPRIIIPKPDKAHHALEDARWIMKSHKWLIEGALP